MKRFLRILLLQLLLVSCADITTPATSTVEITVAVPTSTPAPFAPTLPELIEPQANGTADTPPKFTSGFGGEVKGISQADIDYLVAWEVYQKLYRPEQGPTTWTEQEFLEKFVPEMLSYLDKKSGVELIVQQDAGTGKLLVALVKQSGDTKSVYWDYDGEALANTNPMSLDNDFSDEPGFVKLKPDMSPHFIYNADDLHWYMFAVDADGEPVEWLATNGATRENVDKQWVEVPKEPELFTLGCSLAVNEEMVKLKIPEDYTKLLYADGTQVPMGFLGKEGSGYVFSGVVTNVLNLIDHDPEHYNDLAKGVILNMVLPDGNEVRTCLMVFPEPLRIMTEAVNAEHWYETKFRHVRGSDLIVETLRDQGTNKQVIFVINSLGKDKDNDKLLSQLMKIVNGEQVDIGVLNEIVYPQLGMIWMPE